MDTVNIPNNPNFNVGTNFASNSARVSNVESADNDKLSQNNSTSIDKRTEDYKRSDEQTNVGQNSLVSTQVNPNVADNKNEEAELDVVENAIKDVESFLQIQNRNLSFSIDDKTERSVVTVKDSSSGDVIRQIPSEEVLQLAERIKALQEDIGSSVGVFINNKV